MAQLKPEEMKGGYTTGSCATAGMKAALLALLDHEKAEKVIIENPQGQHIQVPVKSITILSDTSAQVTIMKDAGDDPDVTHGTDIVTTIELNTSGELTFAAGFGVGTVTKDGLSTPKGEPAINPGPRRMMKIVFDDFALAPKGIGVQVTVSVPDGERLAKKTLNHTLGIEGGISIIGTTGIVKPMSEEGFKNSLVPQLQVMKANGCKTAILTPGRIGEDIACNVLGLEKNQLAETSNFIGFMLEKCVEIGFKQIVIIGHVGKLIKLASGSFHTHNRMSDGRMESLVAYAALEGASTKVAQKLFACQTTEAAMPILEEAGLTNVYQRIADRASMRSERYIANEAKVGIIIATLKGEILAVDKRAKEIGEEERWNIPCMS
ncbi:cobalt-precorrin-5B (C(1))-methyltransferase CbiD [Veillonella montpellierensis]|uniref:cobalt-precorrin-5B (C(1))-methyltransferase CbiD n=1 Tax=Veillonella montpellierensis TaxID=187328 RepID=UPI0023FA0E12|nr:cobalt-precorrin-5B (C(1))-methyltransferase CbiD [Veillonella montpellierensis]